MDVLLVCCAVRPSPAYNWQPVGRGGSSGGARRAREQTGSFGSLCDSSAAGSWQQPKGEPRALRQFRVITIGAGAVAQVTHTHTHIHSHSNTRAQTSRGLLLSLLLLSRPASHLSPRSGSFMWRNQIKGSRRCIGKQRQTKQIFNSQSRSYVARSLVFHQTFPSWRPS
jgi:hypothetical protein